MNSIYKKYFTVLLLISIALTSKSQLLFHQQTINGGITVDGKSYRGIDYLAADTIYFNTSVPSSATIIKSFLLFKRGIFIVGNHPLIDSPIQIDLNGNIFNIDSSNIITSEFNCDNSAISGENWIVTKDVTNYVLNSNNKLIIPSQSELMLQDSSRGFVYFQPLLVILYKDLAMPTTNIVVFLNTKNGATAFTQLLNNLNPIDKTKDVGLSFYTSNTNGFGNLNFMINSSLGTNNLGNIFQCNPYTNCVTNSQGSFYYQNNTLFGLDNDTPDAFIDSTDALANIANYIPNNATTFNLYSSTITDPGCQNNTLGFVLAYASPCNTASIAKDSTYEICRGQTIQLQASNANGYKWSTQLNLSDSTVQQPIVNLTVTTTYICQVTDANGCKHTEQHKVLVYPKPQSNAIITNAICGVQQGVITIDTVKSGHAPYTYTINGNSQASPIYSNLTPGAYTITTTNSKGCSYQQINYVNQTNPVNALFTTSPSVGMSPLTVQANNFSTGATTYTWFMQDTINTFNPSYTYVNPGTYTITLIASNNDPSCTDTAIGTIKVLPQDTAGIFIPNVFSPNGDGVNDNYELKIKNAELEVYEMYNRWGVMVSTALDLTKSNIGNVTHFTWTGRTTSGIECSAGTYFYVIKVKLDSAFSKEGTKEFKGFVTLVK